MTESAPEHSTLAEKLARRREKHVQRSKPYRIGFTILAFVIFLGGLALVPLPGPGWAVVFVGLGMLALEFEWAENADGADAQLGAPHHASARRRRHPLRRRR